MSCTGCWWVGTEATQWLPSRIPTPNFVVSFSTVYSRAHMPVQALSWVMPCHAGRWCLRVQQPDMPVVWTLVMVGRLANLSRGDTAVTFGSDISPKFPIETLCCRSEPICSSFTQTILRDDNQGTVIYRADIDRTGPSSIGILAKPCVLADCNMFTALSMLRSAVLWIKQHQVSRFCGPFY